MASSRRAFSSSTAACQNQKVNQSDDQPREHTHHSTALHHLVGRVGLHDLVLVQLADVVDLVLLELIGGVDATLTDTLQCLPLADPLRMRP